MKKEIISWIICIATSIVTALLIVNFGFGLTIVQGDSMNDTLKNKDVLFVDKFTINFKEPSRGDIVICKYPNSSANYIKRVVAVGGETIEIKNGVVIIDGDKTIDTWNGNHRIADMEKTQVPSGSYFVMGDNRSSSLDSRSENVGSLPKENIVGVARLRILPLSSIGGI